jgi:multimeric flavodoxin WrbA
MKFVILNGSPKGEYSNTIHYMRYIMKHRPGHEYNIVDVGRDIKKIEKDPDRLKAIAGDIRSADGVIWSFPLYHLSVPSQLMRFIELLSEGAVTGVFKDKYATTITTSIHFFDHLAHNYVQAVSEDLEMRYVEGFSAEMLDIQKQEWREQLLLFFDHFAGSINEKAAVERKYAPISGDINEYVPGELKAPVSIGDKKIVLVTDAAAGDRNLARMTDVFIKSIDGKIDVVNLNELKIQGGCLGCIKCGYNNVCAYKDDLRSVYYDRIAGADAVVFAGSLKGRSMSSRWKMFWDRSFVNGHCPMVSDVQFGFIISGPLRQMPDMREEFDARSQMNRNHLAGIVTDEYDDPAQITALVQQLAVEIAKGMKTGYHLPPTFLGVGGHLLFRDFIYQMSGIFRADDRYYQKHGLYDFPQKRYKLRAQNFGLKLLMSSDRIRKEFYSRATVENAKGYQKAVDMD